MEWDREVWGGTWGEIWGYGACYGIMVRVMGVMRMRMAGGKAAGLRGTEPWGGSQGCRAMGQEQGVDVVMGHDAELWG